MTFPRPVGVPFDLPMPNQIAIVIPDDHAVLRESLASLLQSQPDFNVVGSAANGEEALQLVQEHRPHVLVLDLFMPRATMKEICRSRSESRAMEVGFGCGSEAMAFSTLRATSSEKASSPSATVRIALNSCCGLSPFNTSPRAPSLTTCT